MHPTLPESDRTLSLMQGSALWTHMHSALHWHSCIMMCSTRPAPARHPQVYVIGEVGILEELDLKGMSYLGGPEDAGKVVALKEGSYFHHDAEVSVGGEAV